MFFCDVQTRQYEQIASRICHTDKASLQCACVYGFVMCLAVQTVECSIHNEMVFHMYESACDSKGCLYEQIVLHTLHTETASRQCVGACDISAYLVGQTGLRRCRNGKVFLRCVFFCGTEVYLAVKTV